MIIISEKKDENKRAIVKMSAEKWLYIVCETRSRVYEFQKIAQEMGLDIPFPLTFDEFICHKHRGRGIKGFIIDRADAFLHTMACDAPIAAISLNAEENEQNKENE